MLRGRVAATIVFGQIIIVFARIETSRLVWEKVPRIPMVIRCEDTNTIVQIFCFFVGLRLVNKLPFTAYRINLIFCNAPILVTSLRFTIMKLVIDQLADVGQIVAL